MLVKQLDIQSWDDGTVYQWSCGLTDVRGSEDQEIILENKICGKKLLMLTATDLYSLGFKKISYMDILLNAIEKLRSICGYINKQNLQMFILNLACQARYLQRQIACEADRQKSQNSPTINTPTRNSSLSNGLKETLPTNSIKQRVSLETLNGISAMVATVTEITNIINNIQLSRHRELGSMRSLILALSIELTSTAQRDQFVENPNDILERSAKTLADYCDRLVQSAVDPLMIQAYHLEVIMIKSDHSKMLKIITSDRIHRIDEMPPVSPATINSKSLIGDEVIELGGQNILGWTENNVQNLLNTIDGSGPLKLIVKKLPQD